MSSIEKDLLQQILRIPSVNPILAAKSSSSNGEQELTDFLVSYCQSQHWPWIRQEVHPNRANLLALIPGNHAVDPLLWEVHQDTVDVEGMKIDPFAGIARKGRIWGRGACDVKGGMAAMLAAATRLSEDSSNNRQPVLLAFSVNEECGFTGARALAKFWDLSVSNEQLGALSGPLPLTELRAARPRQAVVAEPTSLDVVVAHQGVARWKCHAHGRAAHTSRPDEGENAIYAISELTLAVEQLHRVCLAKLPPHPLCGTPSVSVSTVHGGSGVNTVPDHVVVDIDRRLAPGEEPSAAREHLMEWVAGRISARDVRLEHEQPWLESTGLDNSANQECAAQLADVVRSTGIDCNLIGAPYGTNAPALAAVGIPTVVFGPGSIDQAHTEDEWIDENQLSQVVEILMKLACG